MILMKLSIFGERRRNNHRKRKEKRKADLLRTTDHSTANNGPLPEHQRPPVPIKVTSTGTQTIPSGRQILNINVEIQTDISTCISSDSDLGLASDHKSTSSVKTNRMVCTYKNDPENM
ncbi:hypothetical protein CHS0354_038229 [Potamilus streckersoni]|uniref:Uncharacterized protein n=1 Tax=Potamilus streckersoni TaxID=2493646 RepID=A0AAE0W645_9BIVA|nr:hypothetical protein CHS0354_038229 [Potamilus streckersoni]